MQNFPFDQLSATAACVKRGTVPPFSYPRAAKLKTRLTSTHPSSASNRAAGGAAPLRRRTSSLQPEEWDSRSFRRAARTYRGP